MMLRKRAPRSGLSLLEVLTALAIFLLSVVVIGQMVDTASQTAQRAQRMSQAALICESKMSEITAGIVPLESSVDEPVPDAEPEWTVTVAVEPQDWSTVDVDGTRIAGLANVHVTARWVGRAGVEVEYSLSRVLLDPRIRVPAAETTTTTSSTANGTSGSSTSGSGTSGSGTGGGGNTGGGGGGGGNTGGGRGGGGGGRTGGGP